MNLGKEKRARQGKVVSMRIVLIGGPTAIGKTKFVDCVIRNNSEFARPRSYTTRARRDSDQSNELEFVSLEEFERMQRTGLFVVVDEAYGNFYAMTRDSVEGLEKAKKVVIKEIHPRNHMRIRKIFPEVISVILYPRYPDEFWGELEKNNMYFTSDRIARIKEDQEFYALPGDFYQSADIVLLVDKRSTPDSLTQEFLEKLGQVLTKAH